MDQTQETAAPARLRARSDPFLGALALGQRCLEERCYSEALQHFARAHSLGHQTLARHLAAHRGMLRANWKLRRAGGVLKQVLLLGAARLFEPA